MSHPTETQSEARRPRLSLLSLETPGILKTPLHFTDFESPNQPMSGPGHRDLEDRKPQPPTCDIANDSLPSRIDGQLDMRPAAERMCTVSYAVVYQTVRDWMVGPIVYESLVGR